MMITVTGLLKMCGVIITIGGALVYIARAIKALTQPIAEIKETLERHEVYLTRDKARLDRLEAEINDNRDSTKLLLRSMTAMLSHMETGNHTKQMAAIRQDIEHYLIEK